MVENPMREIRIEKVTLNMGVGEAGEKLENAKALLGKVSGRKAVETIAKVRNPTFRIKKGQRIGAKVTLRGKEAEEFLNKALDAVDKKVKEASFDKTGNLSFGVKEYIDFPGMKYDPKIGIVGFDVCVTLKRRGYRVKKRRRKRARRIAPSHQITKEEAIEFMKKKFGVEID